MHFGQVCRRLPGGYGTLFLPVILLFLSLGDSPGGPGTVTDPGDYFTV